MAVKPMAEIFAAMGDEATVEDRTNRLLVEIEKLGFDAPRVNHGDVIERHLRLATQLLSNVFLDLAADIGALPDGRDVAKQELSDALAYIDAYALYSVMEENDEATE